MILAIDPGTRHTAYALSLVPTDLERIFAEKSRWRLKGTTEVSHCGLLRSKEKTLEARIGDFLAQLEETIDTNDISLTIVEKPVVYPGLSGKGDPNDLIDLAMVGGAFRFGEVMHVTPSTWKGQQPKSVTKNKVIRSLSRREMQMVEDIPRSLQHNVYDAIGILLWHLKGKRK